MSNTKYKALFRDGVVRKVAVVKETPKTITYIDEMGGKGTERKNADDYEYFETEIGAIKALIDRQASCVEFAKLRLKEHEAKLDIIKHWHRKNLSLIYGTEL